MSKLKYHILAVFVIAVWGMTFISSKILLRNGLSPAEIFFARFLIAYAGIWVIDALGHGQNRLRFWSDSVKDELLLALVGITGGSVYFIFENMSLEYTLACNTSFIVCMAPLPTIFLTMLYKRISKGEYARSLEDVKVKLTLVLGTVLAVAGLAMIVFNGQELHLSPKGDMLALGGCLCWAVYSIFMGQLSDKYGAIFSTRKVFFYGLVTILPFLALDCPSAGNMSVYLRPEVIGNILFLGVLASLICYVAWSKAMAELGNVTSTNYVYLNPVFTLVGALLILGEPVTWLGAVGSAFILVGVILAGKR